MHLTTKQINKQLKRLHDIKKHSLTGIGQKAAHLLNSKLLPADSTPEYKARQMKQIKKVAIDSPLTLARRTSKRKGFPFGSLVIRKPDFDSFAEIRKTNDYAVSPTGYVGFRKDPHIGLGGMCEEGIPYLYIEDGFRGDRKTYFDILEVPFLIRKDIF